MAEELAAAGSAQLGISLEAGFVERLCSYSDSVAHFPTAVKEVDIACAVFMNLLLK